MLVPVDQCEALEGTAEIHDRSGGTTQPLIGCQAVGRSGRLRRHTDATVGGDPLRRRTPGNDPYLFEPETGARHSLCATGPGWTNGIVVAHPARSFHPSLPGNAAEPRHLAEGLAELDWTRAR